MKSSASLPTVSVSLLDERKQTEDYTHNSSNLSLNEILLIQQQYQSGSGGSGSSQGSKNGSNRIRNGSGNDDSDSMLYKMKEIHTLKSKLGDSNKQIRNIKLQLTDSITMDDNTPSSITIDKYNMNKDKRNRIAHKQEQFNQLNIRKKRDIDPLICSYSNDDDGDNNSSHENEITSEYIESEIWNNDSTSSLQCGNDIKVIKNGSVESETRDDHDDNHKIDKMIEVPLNYYHNRSDQLETVITTLMEIKKDIKLIMSHIVNNNDNCNNKILVPHHSRKKNPDYVILNHKDSKSDDESVDQEDKSTCCICTIL